MASGGDRKVKLLNRNDDKTLTQEMLTSKVKSFPRDEYQIVDWLGDLSTLFEIFGIEQNKWVKEIRDYIGDGDLKQWYDNTGQHLDSWANFKLEVIDHYQPKQDNNLQNKSATSSERDDLTLEELVKQLPKFDGRGDARVWLLQLDDKFQDLDLSTSIRREICPYVVRGEVSLWFLENSGIITDWESFAREFIKTYCPTIAATTEEKQIDQIYLNSVSQPKMSFKSHSQDFRKTFTRYTSPTTPSQQQKEQEKTTNKSAVEFKKVMNDVKTFSGILDKQASEWWNDIIYFFDIIDINDEGKFRFIRSELVGEARRWYQQNQTTITDWSSFQRDFRQKYLSSSDIDNYIKIEQLKQYKQTKNQTLKQYYSELMKLCDEINPTITALLKKSESLQQLFDELHREEQILTIELSRINSEEQIISSVSSGSPHIQTKDNQSPGCQRSQTTDFYQTQFPRFGTNQFSYPSYFSQPYRQPFSHEPPFQVQQRRVAPVQQKQTRFDQSRQQEHVQTKSQQQPGGAVNNRSMRVMVDTGSSGSFISTSALLKVGYYQRFTKVKEYWLADGITPLEVLGMVELRVKISGITTTIQASITKTLAAECILGNDWIDQFNYLTIDKINKKFTVYYRHQKASVPIHQAEDKVDFSVKLIDNVKIKPWAEVTVKVRVPISSCESVLFEPRLKFQYHNFVNVQKSMLKVKNYVALIKVYNSSDKTCFLKQDTFLGTVRILSSTIHVSNINHRVEFERKYLRLHQSSPTSQDSINPEISDIIEKSTSHIQDKQQQQQVRTILHSHHQLFDMSKPKIAPTTVPPTIRTGDHHPVNSKPYKTTPQLQEEMSQIITKMLAAGQIRHSTSSWSSPVVLIQKLDGSSRFVVDYRKLNNITDKDCYPMPDIEDTIRKLARHKYYTKLDLKSGYFQIPLQEEDKHKSAFITRHGLFEFNVLAQGLKNGPPAF
ncbi:unnamed protein product [Didymodactylos carnosus]|uniref:Reverse transcriptase domain-containing protein n=1 Tax=Didymodactylos carnosus TaxID=1234261 RepID=A0A815KAC1_9BILA|nr:unnamed protein product [Didymodactylos carnosus]CAF4283243.1 unnamed protein product [Didymodactylos carnosus]